MGPDRRSAGRIRWTSAVGATLLSTVLVASSAVAVSFDKA
jgi:hypothetical protein